MPVLRRLVALAREAELTLVSWLSPSAVMATCACESPDTLPMVWTQAFQPSLEDFHGLVRLRKSAVPRPDGIPAGPRSTFAASSVVLSAAGGMEHLPAPSENPLFYSSVATLKAKNPPMPLVGYDPVQCFVNDLRQAHGKQLMLFWNPCDPTHVGVVWNSRAFGQSAAGALRDSAVEINPASATGRLVATKTSNASVSSQAMAVLADVLRLGQGLVRDAKLQA